MSADTFNLIVKKYIIKEDLELSACENLQGTWKLVEIRGNITATLGKAPQGFFIFGTDGRALVLITGDKRPKIPDLAGLTDQERIDLFKTMLA